MLYQFEKSMNRELTIEEEKEILLYMKNNQEMPFVEIIKIFETKYNTPITKTCIIKILVKEAIGEIS